MVSRSSTGATEDFSQVAHRAAVLAIVPAHDEAGRVGRVVGALSAQGLPLLVIDDGSSDGTGAEALAAGARVLRLEPNRGKGAALKAGFKAALDVSAEDGGPADGWTAFLSLDGDGQHDPAEVPRFLEVWDRTGADLVVGMRDYRDMPPVRWFTNSVSRLLFSWALGERIPDNQSGYRLRSRRLAEAALSSHEEGFAFEVEEIAICLGGVTGWRGSRSRPSTAPRRATSSPGHTSPASSGSLGALAGE